MIQGLRTALYPVTDLAEATKWYGQVFGCTPYFEEPFYVGFTVGGFELGLVPDGTPGTHGCTALWGVSDIQAEVARIVALGASVKMGPQDVGGGISVAELNDPFGNLLGLIENPNFDPQAMR